MNCGDCEFIRPEEIEASLKAFQTNASITRGHWEGINGCEARDFEWNLVDQSHRLFVHRVYGKTIRLARGRSFSSSLTTLKLLGFPIVVLINDVQIRTGLYYQTIVFFNLIHFHMYEEIIPMGEKSKTTVDWFIVSHPLFKFLHGFLDRHYHRTLDVLNEEDTSIRLRRAELRRRGFKFVYEEPDFLSGNTMTNNTCPPKLNGQHRVLLETISSDGLNKVAAGNIDFLICRESDKEFRVWTDACPHEGGPLSQGKLCKGQIECPWHGLKFTGAKLSPEHPRAEFHNYHFELAGNELIIEEKSASPSFALRGEK